MSNSHAQAVVELNDNGISLKGDLLFSTVSTVLKEGGKYLESHPSKSIIINVSDVHKIDSAAIAMLIGWKRLCDAKNKEYQIHGAQQQVASLITTNKMNSILNLN